ncbi:hypothetical protein [Cellulomonas phragmiteti]|nr:hypothetical protein [Cellulomonas phragmiteti]
MSDTLFRLEITLDGTVIGEYERSRHADIPRKTEEVECAADYLVELYRRRGTFVVRWNSATRTKVVRDHFGNHIGEIPAACWRKPARQTGSSQPTAQVGGSRGRSAFRAGWSGPSRGQVPRKSPRGRRGGGRARPPGARPGSMRAPRPPWTAYCRLGPGGPKVIGYLVPRVEGSSPSGVSTS